MIKKERGPYGKNMIKLAIRFYTNDLPEGTDKKTAWKGGIIYLYKNETKGIKPAFIRFRDINKDFLENLFKLLKNNDIKLIEQTKFNIVNK